MPCHTTIETPSNTMNPNSKQPEASAKISVSFPPDLLKWIEAEAKKDRRHRSTWIQIQLEDLLRSRAAATAAAATNQQPSPKANKRNAS